MATDPWQRCALQWETIPDPNSNTMNPFGRRSYTAAVNAAGRDLESQQSRGLGLLLDDVHVEVMELRARTEEHHRATNKQMSYVNQDMNVLRTDIAAVAAKQQELLDLLNGGAFAPLQVAAQGLGDTMSLLAMEQGQLPARHTAIHQPAPRYGLVGGFLHRLDLWALQLFERNAACK